MSNSAALPTARTLNDQTSPASRTRNARSDRSAGKGRRRRAAAEQRRSEQQHWSRLMHDSEEEIPVAPRPVSRRQLRRSARIVAGDNFEDCHTSYDEAYDDDDLDVALAISLSLLENNRSNDSILAAGSVVSGHGHVDMSYERLVLLENVKCTASSDIVNTLIGRTYMKDHDILSYKSIDELCTVCLVEFKEGDPLMVLPCTHAYHEACGSEWFLNHSKLCPVCKHDVTGVP